MEWTAPKARKMILAAAVAAATLSAALPAFAGVAFTERQSRDVSDENTEGLDPIRDEPYAESRFGTPPARGGYVRQEVDEEDARARITSRVSQAQGLGTAVAEFDSYARRSPAGAGRSPAALRDASESQPRAGHQGLVEVGGEETAASAPELPGDAELSPLVKRKGVQEVALIASDTGFYPKTVFVTRDIPVRIFVTGTSKQSSCLLIDAFQVRKQVRSQKIEEVTFTAAVPGRYRFYCPINGSEGTLVVKEFGVAPQRLAGTE